jgi:DNA polymerase-3 subunit beta
MEFSVKRSDLLDELNLTQGVVERKSTIPILSNLLVEAKGSRLTITATDLELSIRTSCEAKVKKEGAGTIPAKKLFELMRLLPEGEVKFKQTRYLWSPLLMVKVPPQAPQVAPQCRSADRNSSHVCGHLLAMVKV